MPWIPVMYPREEANLISDSDVYGQSSESKEEARKRLQEMMGISRSKGTNDSPYLVLVENGKVRQVEEATGRQTNPESADEDIDLELRWSGDVWKTRPSNLEERRALRGIIKRTELARRDVQAVVNEAKPKPAVTLSATERKEKEKDRVTRALLSQWQRIAEGEISPFVRQLTISSVFEIQDRTRELVKKDATPAEIGEKMAAVVVELLSAKETVDELVGELGLAALEDAITALIAKDPSWQNQQMGRLAAELAKVPTVEVEVPPTTIKTVKIKLGKVTAIQGERTKIYYPQSTAQGGVAGLGTEDAFYALVPMDGVIQSHDPWTFSENPDYHRECQERDYQRDNTEQAKVIRHTGAFIPKLVLSTNPDAINGPPIIDRSGVVLGGNSRVMTMKRVMKDRPAFYAGALRSEIGECGEFGLKASDVQPDMILCRVILKVLSAAECPVMSRNLNRSMTHELGAAAKAVSLGGMLPPELYHLIGDEMVAGDTTINAILDKRSQDVVRLLQRANVITEQNVTEFVKAPKGQATSQLSIGGRQAIRNAVMGALVGDKEYLSLTNDRMEGLYERIAPLIMGVEPSSEFSLRDDMRTAIAALSIFKSGNLPDWRSNFSSGSLDFDAASKARAEDRLPALFSNARAALLATWLIEAQSMPRVAYDAMRVYARGIPGSSKQATLISDEVTPGELLKRSLGARWPVVNYTPAEVEAIGVTRYLSGLADVPKRSESQIMHDALGPELGEAWDNSKIILDGGPIRQKEMVTELEKRETAEVPSSGREWPPITKEEAKELLKASRSEYPHKFLHERSAELTRQIFEQRFANDVILMVARRMAPGIRIGDAADVVAYYSEGEWNSAMLAAWTREGRANPDYKPPRWQVVGEITSFVDFAKREVAPLLYAVHRDVLLNSLPDSEQYSTANRKPPLDDLLEARAELDDAMIAAWRAPRIPIEKSEQPEPESTFEQKVWMIGPDGSRITSRPEGSNYTVWASAYNKRISPYLRPIVKIEDEEGNEIPGFITKPKRRELERRWMAETGNILGPVDDEPKASSPPKPEPAEVEKDTTAPESKAAVKMIQVDDLHTWITAGSALVAAFLNIHGDLRIVFKRPDQKKQESWTITETGHRDISTRRVGTAGQWEEDVTYLVKEYWPEPPAKAKPEPKKTAKPAKTAKKPAGSADDAAMMDEFKTLLREALRESK